jgi:exodeoxyribonuclease VII small subunit
LQKRRNPREWRQIRRPLGAPAARWQHAAGPATISVYPQGEAQEVAKEPALPKEIAGLSFEDALKELEGIVQQLERGQVKLDEAISAYERGALLKRHCEQKLAEAKMKVEKIVFSADGSASTEPADLK